MSGEQRTQYVLAALPAIPDLNYTLEDMVAEGDKVVARYTARFTHKGTYMGIPATGKQVAAKGVEIYRLAGGKIVESWDFPDTLGMMTQLGAIPGRAPQK
jgi:predicted ester cyclase